MNEKNIYWKWKSLIIDFSNLTDEKNDYGEYIKKKDMVFAYLGTPDEEIHEWYNGKYSSEYNEAFRYAKQLNLIEEYIDYEDLLNEKDKEIERLNNVIQEALNYIDDNTYYKDHKGHININDLYIILQGDDKDE